MEKVATRSASEQWVPQSENETRVKDALQTVFITSPGSVIIKAPDNKTDRFVLQTEGYFDLYQYVDEGKTYTSSSGEFEKRFVKTAFDSVEKFDPRAYDLLRDTTVSVSTHCDEFSKNSLPKFKISANGAIAFAEQCIDLLDGDPQISLHNNFQTLTDEEYRIGQKDEAFMVAKDNAKSVVKDLAKVSKTKGEDAAAMVGLLQDFYTTTQNDSKNVQKIKEDFLTGPIDPNTGKRKQRLSTSAGGLNISEEVPPYCTIMDAEITRLQENITAQIEIEKTKDDEWTTAKNAAISLGVFGAFVPWLWIGMGFETKYAADAANAYHLAVEQEIKDKEDKANKVLVTELVRALVNHYHELLPKMKKAMHAMEVLGELFTTQNLNFQEIDNQFENLLTGADAETWQGRKWWILNGIDKAVEKFKEIVTLAKEFNRNAEPKIVKL